MTSAPPTLALLWWVEGWPTAFTVTFYRTPGGTAVLHASHILYSIVVLHYKSLVASWLKVSMVGMVVYQNQQLSPH